MSDRHVVPGQQGWLVEKDNAQRPSAKAAAPAEAVKRAAEIVANDGRAAALLRLTRAPQVCDTH
jgi:hypothetical protein